MLPDVAETTRSLVCHTSLAVRSLKEPVTVVEATQIRLLPVLNIFTDHILTANYPNSQGFKF